ncbi:hypothetical protein AKJ09_04043 [Labilithrix luteola]|uniref:Uncharacterized protein n=1 Tax=Labilithrix luteola TaxID=1391654 RepID=A0A0K1PW61_9BACT|nr:hypothetical protein AKJ09_04043 [Labilithrix luteola]
MSPEYDRGWSSTVEREMKAAALRKRSPRRVTFGVPRTMTGG